MKDQLCPICWDNLSENGYNSIARCNCHIFHFDCFMLWFYTSYKGHGRMSCPLCNGVVILLHSNCCVLYSFSDAWTSKHFRKKFSKLAEYNRQSLDLDSPKALIKAIEFKDILFLSLLFQNRYPNFKKAIYEIGQQGKATRSALIHFTGLVIVELESRIEFLLEFIVHFQEDLQKRLCANLFRKYYMMCDLQPHERLPWGYPVVLDAILSMRSPLSKYLHNKVLIPCSIKRNDFTTFYNTLVLYGEECIFLGIKKAIMSQKSDFLEIALCLLTATRSFNPKRTFRKILKWSERANFTAAVELAREWFFKCPIDSIDRDIREENLWKRLGLWDSICFSYSDLGSDNSNK